jgi:hypothetical protein
VNDTASAQFSPDGLDLRTINTLLVDVDAELHGAAQPTSALLDGSAAERRRRRIENRAFGAVVRALPARRVMDLPNGQEAA